MSLATGARLGSFEIVGKLGAGGMGEVWRATDTRLGRQVALKLLPEDFALDPERHDRFEREARVLASLNHPNIAVLFGLATLVEFFVQVSEHSQRAFGQDFCNLVLVHAQVDHGVLDLAERAGLERIAPDAPVGFRGLLVRHVDEHAVCVKHPAALGPAAHEGVLSVGEVPDLATNLTLLGSVSVKNSLFVGSSHF